MNDIEFKYIEEANVTEESYLEFLKTEYKERATDKFGKRREWYKKKDGFRILLAMCNNEIVGQACAYKDNVVINGKETIIWWGCDNFVLAKTRGMGVGKKLQMKLHEDLPNFSSAWYAPINGIIKTKCGSKPLFDVAFVYYPVSRFFTIFISKAIKKFLKKKVNINIRLPFFYTVINKCTGYKRVEIKETLLNENVCDFITNSTLNEHDFYTKRDKKYLNWRYNENPNLKFYTTEIIRDGELEAVLLFTHAHIENGIVVTKILDVFKKKDCMLNNKDLLISVASFFKKKRVSIDGIQLINVCKYYPCQINKAPFLSTIKLDANIKNAYISYTDQDMAQMY